MILFFPYSYWYLFQGGFCGNLWMLRSENYKLFENGKIVQNLVPSVAPICSTCNGFEHRFGSKIMSPLWHLLLCEYFLDSFWVRLKQSWSRCLTLRSRNKFKWFSGKLSWISEMSANIACPQYIFGLKVF